jgi:hypothetical protein
LCWCDLKAFKVAAVFLNKMMDNDESLVKILVDQMPKLRDFYKREWPLHIATYSTISLFYNRFLDHPQWIDRVDFLSFDNDWQTTGAFVMIQDNRVFFNTLEEFPFKTLRRLLLSIQLDDEVAFINIRDLLRPIIYDTLRIHYFEVVSDIGTKSFLMPKDVLQTLDVK